MSPLFEHRAGYAWLPLEADMKGEHRVEIAEQLGNFARDIYRSAVSNPHVSGAATDPEEAAVLRRRFLAAPKLFLLQERTASNRSSEREAQTQ